MTEKEAKKRAEEIIEALTALSLGHEPKMFSKEVLKKLVTHPNYRGIRDAYVNYLQLFEGKNETQEEIKRLFDLRMKIVNLFDAI